MSYLDAREVNIVARTNKMFNRASWKRMSYRYSAKFVHLVMTHQDVYLVADCRQVALKNVPYSTIDPRRGRFLCENVIEALMVSGIHIDLTFFSLKLENIKAVVCIPDVPPFPSEDTPVQFGRVFNIPACVCKTMKSLTVQHVPHFGNEILPQLSLISADVELSLPRPFQVPALNHVCLNSSMDLNISVLNQYATVKTLWIKTVSDLWRLKLYTELIHVENLFFLFWNNSFDANQELAQDLVDLVPNLKTLALQAADTGAKLSTPPNVNVQIM